MAYAPADAGPHGLSPDARKSDRHTLAWCGGIHIIVVSADGRRKRTLGIFADAHFHRDRLGTEVVTHELFHATMAWGRRVGFPFARLGDDDAVNRDEEIITHVHGRLCRQFVARAEAAGLYK